MDGVTERVDGELRVRPGFSIPAGELAVRFSRSSGPGGQGVNTTDSRVELMFDVARSASVPEGLRPRLLDALAGRLTDGVLTVRASEYRAQLRNRQAARQRLANLLDDAAKVPPPPRRRPKRPRGVNERRLASKQHRSDLKRTRRRPVDHG
jgi:ribosome-associated protein